MVLIESSQIFHSIVMDARLQSAYRDDAVAAVLQSVKNHDVEDHMRHWMWRLAISAAVAIALWF